MKRQDLKRQENRAVLAWRGAASAGLVSSADRAYMKAPVPRPTLQLVDKVSRSCGHTPGKVAVFFGEHFSPFSSLGFPIIGAVYSCGFIEYQYITENSRTHLRRNRG